MARIMVLGAGGWGTALAVMSNTYGNTVTLWSPFAEEIVSIRRDGEHRKLLPGIPVPAGITLTTELTAAQAADLIILAVPSFAIADTAEALAPYVPQGTLIANAGKGLEKTHYLRFSEVIRKRIPQARVVVLSGPSHAEEVGHGVPTSLVAASQDIAAAEQVQDMLSNPVFRLYVNDDVIGVELGGALKNVIALAAGICDGLGMGSNTKAALMTRGLAEMARLGVAMGAHSETFAGLSGMGDLIVTCDSMHSRNRRAGILIGQGVSPEEAIKQVGTVEGYLAAKAARSLAKKADVDMPIVEQCYRICYKGENPRKALSILMKRPKKHENETPWIAK